MPCRRSCCASVCCCCLESWRHAQGNVVVWTNLVNVAVTGDVLQKTNGCDGCDDAGASSQQQLIEGDGYVEFTVGETTTFWMAGLSHGDTDTTFTDIDFGFRFNGSGWADVLEAGIYQGGDTPYAAGDVFRIAVVAGRVQYFKNGVFLRESAQTPEYPLLLDSSLGSMGADHPQRDDRRARSAAATTTGRRLPREGRIPLRCARASRVRNRSVSPGEWGTRTVFLSRLRTHGCDPADERDDCEAGQDCIWPVGYSYWRNTNAHAGSPVMLIFLEWIATAAARGRHCSAYNKTSDDVQNVGPLFADDSPFRYATGEGWYFSRTLPTILYTYLVGGSQLLRYDVLARQFDPVPALDLQRCLKRNVCPAGAAFIFQPHSSDDDLVHSATVQDSEFRTARLRRLPRPWQALHVLSPSGLATASTNVTSTSQDAGSCFSKPRRRRALNNRVIDLSNGGETVIDDAQGALGHLDMGWGYAVGADNFNPSPNATILLKFPVTSTVRPVGPVVHVNKRWDIAAANHVTHGNAAAGLAPESQYACGSNASRVADMADEIVCFSTRSTSKRRPDRWTCSSSAR